MQGNLAEQSITNALDRIFPYEDFFDVVVIIRGGGSQSDLSCFDNYNLAFHVTQFPIPVLTGIGHEKDDSIVDLVAHTRLKTPTAVAEFILNGVEAFEERIEQIQNEVVGLTKDRLRDEKARLDRITREVSYEIRSKLESRKKDLMNMTWRFQHEIRLTLQERKHWLEKKMQRTGLLIDRFIFVKQQKLETVQDQANQIVKRKIKKEKLRLAELPELLKHRLQRKLDLENHRLELADQKAKLFDPANVLKRGYSITVYDGGLVKDLSLIKQSELITTRLYKGSLISKVLKINQSDNNDN
jgi:exodeoxyribonuclease VII large subunit